MSEVLDTLMEKEKELRAKLEQTPIFKQWESLKMTITLFENGNGSANNTEQITTTTTNRFDVPTVFSPDLTWKQKVLFALGQLNAGFVSDIIAELRKHGVQGDDGFLTKRISTTASNMKSRKILGSKSFGVKERYFIK